MLTADQRRHIIDALYREATRHCDIAGKDLHESSAVWTAYMTSSLVLSALAATLVGLPSGDRE